MKYLNFNTLLALVIFLVVLISSMTFTVQEGKTAIKVRLGQIKNSDYTPGLHFKLPFIDSIKTLDKRLQSLDAAPEKVLTINKKELLVDYFVEWRIADAKKFYVSTSSGSMLRAEQILGQISTDDLRAEFAKRTVNQVVSEDRSVIMQNMTKSVSEKAKEIGLDIVDVRVKRVEFADSIKSTVYARMRSERERLSASLRAAGREQEQLTRANADRQARVIQANAQRQSDILRGQGDAKATEIYANAFGKDPDFYRFQRSLEAYNTAFTNKSNTLITSPDSSFFDFFKQSAEQTLSTE